MLKFFVKNIFARIAVFIVFAFLLVPSTPALAQTGGFKLIPDCAKQEIVPGQPLPPPPSLACGLQVFLNIAQIILGLTGSLALLMFVWGGFKMLTAAGNDQKVAEGKTVIKNAVIGIVIVFTAGMLVRYGLSVLVSNPETPVIGAACDNGQGTYFQKDDGTIACVKSCQGLGEGYACTATSQAGNRSCVSGAALGCAADQLCCKTQ